jgi:hypothetical protein
MNDAKIVFVTLLALCALFLTACDDNGSSGSLTSVDNSKKVEDLSGEELQQMCEDYAEAVAKAVGQEFFCTLAGIEAATMLGGSKIACEAAYNTCVEIDMEFDIEEFFSCEDVVDSSDDTEDCDATVGEVDRCIQDTLKLFEDMADSISCSISSPEDLEDIWDLEDPASCQALGDQCLDMDDIELPF